MTAYERVICNSWLIFWAAALILVSPICADQTLQEISGVQRSFEIRDSLVSEEVKNMKSYILCVPLSEIPVSSKETQYIRLSVEFPSEFFAKAKQMDQARTITFAIAFDCQLEGGMVGDPANQYEFIQRSVPDVVLNLWPPSSHANKTITGFYVNGNQSSSSVMSLGHGWCINDLADGCMSGIIVSSVEPVMATATIKAMSFRSTEDLSCSCMSDAEGGSCLGASTPSLPVITQPDVTDEQSLDSSEELLKSGETEFTHSQRLSYVGHSKLIHQSNNMWINPGADATEDDVPMIPDTETASEKDSDIHLHNGSRSRSRSSKRGGNALVISLSVSFGVIILLVVAGCLSCFIVRRVFHKPVHRNSSQDMARVINSDCGDTNLDVKTHIPLHYPHALSFATSASRLSSSSDSSEGMDEDLMPGVGQTSAMRHSALSPTVLSTPMKRMWSLTPSRLLSIVMSGSLQSESPPSSRNDVEVEIEMIAMDAEEGTH